MELCGWDLAVDLRALLQRCASNAPLYRDVRSAIRRAIYAEEILPGVTIAQYRAIQRDEAAQDNAPVAAPTFAEIQEALRRLLMQQIEAQRAMNDVDPFTMQKLVKAYTDLTYANPAS